MIFLVEKKKKIVTRKSNLLREKETMKHQYQIDIFFVDLNSQLREMNSRFEENEVELLVLSLALDPRDGYISFRVDDICKLANKFYPEDFTE